MPPKKENDPEVLRLSEEIEHLQQRVDSYNQEVNTLYGPFPQVERDRAALVVELRSLLNSIPMKPSILREIRKEIERLELLTIPQVTIRKTVEELQVLEQRLVEIQQHLGKGQRTHAIFPTPTGAGWEDIEIRFLGDHRLEADAFQERAVFNYVEAGFEDRRNGNPNSAWILLRELAKAGGCFERPLVVSEKLAKVEKAVQSLRNCLKKLFELNDDPFHPFRKVKCYQTRFKVSFPRAQDR
jgi:hypothetical protein